MSVFLLGAAAFVLAMAWAQTLREHHPCMSTASPV